MLKLFSLSVCGLALIMAFFAFNSTDINANTKSSMLVYNSVTQSYSFQGQTRYANQPLEKKMVALQTIIAQ